ncbi:MAG: glycosyltransferase family 4 protein [Chloroflexi bacterium]|nr:glycosyltransferase family 4 protein [Chloroflexota bacterium]
MKIGYFITHFPYPVSRRCGDYARRYIHGGAEVVAYHLALEMARRGHQVKVFATSIDSCGSTEWVEQVQVFRYATNFRIIRGNLSWGLLREPFKHDLDLVHAHFSTPPAEVAAWRYSHRYKVPFLLTYHGDWEPNFGSLTRRVAVNLLNLWLTRRLLGGAVALVSPSRYYLEESRFLPSYRGKVVAIPNGIDPSALNTCLSQEQCRAQLGLPAEAPILFFLGDLIPKKGPHILLRAMPEILAKTPRALLVIGGDGAMREELSRLALSLGIRDRVRLVGFVNDNLKPLYFHAADVFVLPSITTGEVFPVVLLEASAAGLPMVVSDLNTFRCIVEQGYNGMVARREDEKDLARAIVLLLQDTELARTLGQNAREKVKEFSWNRIAEETERLYEAVVRR